MTPLLRRSPSSWPAPKLPGEALAMAQVKLTALPKPNGGLLPRLFLRGRPGTHRLTKPEWRSRPWDFQAGRWVALLLPAAADAPPPAASSALVSGPLAPLAPATLAELQDPARRPDQP